MEAKMTTDQQIPKTITVQAHGYNLSDFSMLYFFTDLKNIGQILSLLF